MFGFEIYLTIAILVRLLQADAGFPSVPMRGVQNQFILYQQYMRAQEALGHAARIPYIPR